MGAQIVDASQLARVVERCYDAILLPDLWPAIFQDFADAANSTGLISFQFGADTEKSAFLCSPSLEESIDVYVKEGWFARNPRIACAPLLSSPHHLISDKDLALVQNFPDNADRAWRHDFLQRQGLGWFAGTDFFYNDGIDRVGISIERSIKLEPFQTGELVVMHRALAHVRRALTFAPALDDAAARGLLTGLETTGQAAGLLDRSGRVILLNARAEKLLGKTMMLHDGRLLVRAPQANRRLQRLVASLVRQGARCDDDPVDFVMLPQMQGRPLIVRGAPIAAVGAELFKRAKAFITFAEVGKTAPDESMLRNAFKLTPAEIRIALSIGAGQDVKDIARTQAVATATVRTHLKAIFAKTDTRRQAALAILIASLPHLY